MSVAAPAVPFLMVMVVVLLVGWFARSAMDKRIRHERVNQRVNERVKWIEQRVKWTGQRVKWTGQRVNGRDR